MIETLKTTGRDEPVGLPLQPSAEAKGQAPVRDPALPLPGGPGGPGEPGGRSRGHWAVLGGGALGVLALTILRTLTTPDARGYGTHEQLGLPACLTMDVAGVPCPGCGVTTSVTLVTHGRWVDAFLTQPFGVLVALAIPVFVAWSVWGHLRGVDLYASLTGSNAKRWIVPALAALTVAWVYKLVVTFG